MTDDNPNTETRDDIVKLEFNFSAGEPARPYRAFIKKKEHRARTDRSLTDSIRDGAVVELNTLGKARSTNDYEFYEGDKEVLIDFSKVACAVKLSEAEVKTDE